jgi:hypothetical protein
MNIINIKKILLILIMFTSITFINIAFAFDGWFSPDQARCKVEYTRLNLVTGVETRKKHTYQGKDWVAENDEGKDDNDWGDDYEHNCGTYFEHLASKIDSWLLDDRKNIIVDMSAMYCKTRTDDGIFSNKWSKYKQCHAVFSQGLIDTIIEPRYFEDQRGYNAHKDRLKGLIWEEQGIYNEPYD